MQGFYAKNLREFTKQLFLTDSFDAFLVPEASFVTGFTSSFDGRVPKPAEGEAVPAEPYVSWGVLRPTAFALIKGKTLPRSFSLVFMLSREKTEAFLTSCNAAFAPEEVGGLYLNVRYNGEKLAVTTGCALTVFSLDKSLEQAWDRQILNFLSRLGLEEA